MPSNCSAEEPVSGRSILWCLTPVRATSLGEGSAAEPRLVIELLLRPVAEALLCCSSRVATVKCDSPTSTMTPFLHAQTTRAALRHDPPIGHRQQEQKQWTAEHHLQLCCLWELGKLWSFSSGPRCTHQSCPTSTVEDESRSSAIKAPSCSMRPGFRSYLRETNP